MHWKICLAHKVTVVLFFLPQFAEWCLTSSERQTNTPDRPFSLFEGMELNCLPPTCPSIIESSTPTPPLLNYAPPTPPLQNMFVSVFTSHSPHASRVGRDYLHVCRPIVWCAGVTLPCSRATCSEEPSEPHISQYLVSPPETGST